jgi:tetrachlorobenzoquinone reductase
MNPNRMIDVVVRRKSAAAEGVVTLELADVSGEPLPAFAAGAHIDVELPLPGGPQLRQYSLCNAPGERHRYVIGVGLDANSRGGSSWIHAQLQEGMRLRISAPRNNFPLAESAEHTVLVAGGIGVTPLLAMARRLTELGRRWTLYYCVRTPARAAFLGELMALGGEVVPMFDGMPGVGSVDLVAVLAQAPAFTHFYCCGPAGLMKAFLAASAARDAATVHVEWFAAPAASNDEPVGEGEFQLHLARTQRTLAVLPKQSILDVLLDAGIDVPYSCRDGVCGSCETRVLAGECDHRDLVLMPAEAAANDRIMLCVSRCKGAALTLDL